MYQAGSLRKRAMGAPGSARLAIQLRKKKKMKN